MARSVSLAELVAEEYAKGILVFAGGRTRVDYEPLTADERKAVNECFMAGLRHLEKVAPEIAASIRPQLSLVEKFAGIAKAVFPETKPIAYPSEPGTIGVNWLFPQAIKYAASASSTYPCYTSYSTNLWEISLTAGAAAYLFGDGSNYYKASPTTGQHAMLLVFQDGVVEVGSTPKIQQFQIKTEIQAKYGIYTVEPLVEVPLESGKAIYQYPTPMGAVPIYHDLGIMWGFMPAYSGTATIKLLGMVFYEHDFAAELKWVS